MKADENFKKVKDFSAKNVHNFFYMCWLKLYAFPQTPVTHEEKKIFIVLLFS